MQVKKTIYKYKFGAGNGVRTRDPKLGKLVLYQLSYARLNALYNRQLIKVNSFLRHFCSESPRYHGHGLAALVLYEVEYP